MHLKDVDMTVSSIDISHYLFLYLYISEFDVCKFSSNNQTDPGKYECALEFGNIVINLM